MMKAKGEKSGGMMPRGSEGVESEKLPRGNRILTSFPQDNAGNVMLPDTEGGKFGGSPTNLSHSLNGASAVTETKGRKAGTSGN
jgi:hypothetical protein